MSLDVSSAVKPWREEKHIRSLEIDEESLFQPFKALFLKENIQNDGTVNKEVLQTLTSLCFPSTPSPKAICIDSRDIMQLKQSILPLQQRIQHLVYAHSRALFFRKGNVNTIRTDILKTMIALKDVQNAIHQCLNKQLKFKTEGLEKLDQWKNEQQYLSMYIREKEKSDENFKLISSLVQKKDKLAQEINETEIKLAEKKNDLKNILNHIEELHNSFGTRFSKEKSRLAEISADETRFIEQFKKLIPHSNQEKSRDALREMWETELSLINDDIKLIHSEYTALSEGSKLWCSTIIFLQSLEQNVYECTKKGSCKVSEIINIIDKGLLRLRDLTRIVNNQHLNLLYIAIGYEIEALNRTRRVILSTEDKV
ncbi:uncharacterized protein T551_01761 [Pneumocystis jirovecii RU7]|uniref:Uncharacterized protein n=1 Tax=Pneumocystis jirovecii (strain RU7) TaxID=1408657 RepID=A0A0W4ZQ47_PNEJ7|nr:uncharacterized protein T551_01761 [Pneumocystis jirovecii RU7]KTW30478.1 hypothetical protein T551_01761 [Pneumocystis jirovecii RU7]